MPHNMYSEYITQDDAVEMSMHWTLNRLGLYRLEFHEAVILDSWWELNRLNMQFERHTNVH